MGRVAVAIVVVSAALAACGEIGHRQLDAGRPTVYLCVGEHALRCIPLRSSDGVFELSSYAPESGEWYAQIFMGRDALAPDIPSGWHARIRITVEGPADPAFEDILVLEEHGEKTFRLPYCDFFRSEGVILVFEITVTDPATGLNVANLYARGRIGCFYEPELETCRAQCAG